MATITAQGDPNLAAVVNDSGSNGIFSVYDGNAPATAFEVKSLDGAVRLYGTVHKAGSHALQNLYVGTGTMAEFRSTTSQTTRFVFSNETTGVRVSAPSSTPLQLQAETAKVIKSTGSGVVAAFVDSSGNTVVEVTDDDETMKLYSGGVQTASIGGEDASGDARLQLGVNATANVVRGKLVLRRDGTADLERQGVLIMHDESGQGYYLWVDTAGKLWIDTSDPVYDDNPTSGAIIGPP